METIFLVKTPSGHYLLLGAKDRGAADKEMDRRRLRPGKLFQVSGLIAVDSSNPLPMVEVVTHHDGIIDGK